MSGRAPSTNVASPIMNDARSFPRHRIAVDLHRSHFHVVHRPARHRDRPGDVLTVPSAGVEDTPTGGSVVPVPFTTRLTAIVLGEFEASGEATVIVPL